MEMSDKLDNSKQPEYSELKEQLEKVNWPIDYGSVTVQIRNKKPTLLKVEQTIKLD